MKAAESEAERGLGVSVQCSSLYRLPTGSMDLDKELISPGFHVFNMQFTDALIELKRFFMGLNRSLNLRPTVPTYVLFLVFM